VQQSHGKAVFTEILETKAFETIRLQGLLQDLANRTEVRAGGQRFGSAA